MSSETLTLVSSTLYLKSHPSHSSLPPLPPVPTDFPLPKLIPKTRFIVDGFRFSGDYSVSYFLSHFHSDHYTGLTPNWSKGIIFCSHTTARLLIDVLKVSSSFVFPLSLSNPYLIDGCEVSLIDANHCPGAVQFLFKVPVSNGKFERYVHTGDFRYCNSMEVEPGLTEYVGADAVFLDTTYCNPKFMFPLQEESIDYVVGVIEKLGVENEGNPKSVLFLVATYVIGKEKILLEISRRCKRKIHVEDKKLSILGALGFGENGVFTGDEAGSDVHVVGWNVLGETWPYFRPNFVKMKEIMNERGYSKVVGFVPTGWTYEVKRNKFAVRMKDSFEIHLVPYSEHSNYDELRKYVRFLRPKRVIPTVGLDVENIDGKHAAAMRKHFAGLVDEMAIKQEFLMRFHRGTQESDGKLETGSSKVINKVIEQDKEVNNPDQGAYNKICAEKIINCTVPEQEPGSQDLVLPNDADTDEMLQELRDCLPAWVTRDQMLDLLSSSGRNVVDAVSNFYEHETEFHEQVVVSTSSACESQVNASEFHKQVIACTPCASHINLSNDSALLSDPFSVHGATKSVSIPLLQSHRSPNAKKKVKSGTSPSRKRKNPENKPNKKSRITSTLESGGPKQYTITRFFSKLSPVVSQDCEPVTLLEARSNTVNTSPSNVNRSYEEDVDQFIQIIDGSESMRSYVATILEETKGDINVALDMYYSNLKGKLSEEKVAQSINMVKAQCSVVICSSDDETKVLESDIQDKSMPKQSTDCVAVNSVSASPEKDTTDILMHEPPTDSLARDLISLPPEKYSPAEHACWKDGEPAPYIHLARTFSLLEDEKGKIRATSMLCNMFRSLLVLTPEDVLPAIYLCTNKIAPDHENLELNIGGSIVTAALEEACGTNRSRIRDLYNSLGDLGDVAQLCRQTQSLLAPPPPLSIRGVFSVLRKISVQTGSGSTLRKKSLIVNLMRSCREKEIKFLVRTLVRNLRIGAMMRTVLPALAQAVVMNSSSHKGKKEHSKEMIQGLSAAAIEAYNILPNLNLLVPSLIDKGIQFTATTLSMVPGIPIKPMLAKISNGIPQVLKLFQNKAFTCEYKYDGQRAQIHKLDDGSVRVFSRNGDETTSRFPDLVNIIRESCTSAALSFILDAEVVAVDRKNGYKLMSFQELSSRERGSKDSLISVDNIKVDICVFAFDIMFANGEQLLGVPLRQRRKYMKDLFGDEKLGYFEYATETTVEADAACVVDEATPTLTKMNLFLDDALRSSCEGIMVKSLDVEAGYTPSKRSDTWLKVKRDYIEGLNDSLDLVPIGAWHGNGRKAGWYSPFLLACYNPDTEEYQSVCRVMSGFSDAFYIEMKEFFSDDKVLSKKPPYYQTTEVPDMWFSPEVVWAIRGADFTVSPVHHAGVGLVHPSRGISIRFPRFVRTVSDRKPEECSTSTDIAEMFNSQTRKMDVSGGH